MVFLKEVFNLRPSQEILDLQQNVVDNLKPKEIAKIKELRSRLETLLKPSHNDFYLMKWLKARKFDVTAAENMLRENLKWRRENRVDHIFEDFEPPEVLLKYMPFGLAGEDKEGAAVWILPNGNFDIRASAYCVQKSDYVKIFIYCLEYMNKISIRQSEKHKKVITTQVIVFDMDNFNFQDFIWKPAFDMCSGQLKVFEAYYPELLKYAFMVRAPTLYQIFFAMCKPFISEDTKNKISIYGKTGWQERLLEIIDEDQLPKHWGGTLVDKEDGNPYCSIVMGGPIPDSLRKTLKTDKDKMKNFTIPAKGVITKDIEITKKGSVLSWEYQTEEHDLAFSLSFVPDSSEQNNNSERDEDQLLIPWDKANSYLVPQDGQWKCQQTGTYTVTFDNSYSWYRSKKMVYSIQVRSPDSTITEISLNNEE